MFGSQLLCHTAAASVLILWLVPAVSFTENMKECRKSSDGFCVYVIAVIFHNSEMMSSFIIFFCSIIEGKWCRVPHQNHGTQKRQQEHHRDDEDCQHRRPQQDECAGCQRLRRWLCSSYCHPAAGLRWSPRLQHFNRTTVFIKVAGHCLHIQIHNKNYYNS